MKLLVAFVLMSAAIDIKLLTVETIKAELVFKGIQNSAGRWQLIFDDRKRKTYQFNAKRSNTEPFVFYTTGVDGSLNENEKIKGSWFLVSYNMASGRNNENLITKVEAMRGAK